MIDYLTEFMPSIFRASVFLAMTSVLAWLFCTGKRYPRLQRIVWFVVLLQGLVLIQFELPTRWLPNPAQYAMEGLQLPQADMELDFAPIVGQSDEIVVSVSTLVAKKPASTIGWRQIAVGVWLAGMFFVFTWQVVAYIQFLRSVEYAGTPEEWEREWASSSIEAKLDAEVQIRATTNVGPLVCWVPSGYHLLVPTAQWSALSKPQRDTILRHEIAHIQRGDMWKSAVVRLLALPHWFNPFAWLTVRRFEDCAEWACDDAARDSMPEAMSDYARALLELARTDSPAPTPVSAANGRPLVERIQRVLNPTGKETRLMKTKALLAITVVALLTGVNSVRLVQAGQQEEQESKSEPNNVVVGSKKSEQPESPKSVVDSTKLELPERPQGEKSKDPLADVAKQKIVSGVLIPPREDEAVVDVARLIQEHPRFTQLRKELQAKIDGVRLATHKMQMKSIDDPSISLGEYREKMQKSLMAEESKVYLKIFRAVQSEIAKYARQNGIRVVRRVATMPVKPKQEELTPQQVIELMNRPVVFIDDQPRDITEAILKRIKEKEKKVVVEEPTAQIPVLNGLPIVGPVFKRQPNRR